MCSRAGNWWEHFQSDCLWYPPGRTALFCAVEVKKKCRFLARISPISLGLIHAMTVRSIFDVISRGNCVKNMRRGFQKHVEKLCGVSTDPRNFHSKYNGRLKTAVMYRNCTEIATIHITILWNPNRISLIGNTIYREPVPPSVRYKREESGQ